MRHIALALLLTGCALAQPTPILLDGKTLWTVQTPRAGISAANRAAETSATLFALANDNRVRLEDTREVHLESESLLLIGRSYVFSATEEDARLSGIPRRQLFASHRDAALAALRQYRASREWPNLLRGAALSAGYLLAGFFLVILIHRGYRKATAFLHSRILFSDHPPRWSGLIRVFQRPLALLVRSALFLVFLVLGASVVAIVASSVLSQFPATASLADQVFLTGLQVLTQFLRAVLDYLPNLFVLLLVCVFTYGLIRLSRSAARAIDEGHLHLAGFHREWAQPTYALLRVLLILFALVVAFPYLPGGESPALKGASLFIGVLVSLGSGSAMGNVISGVILTYMRPFRVGDRVRISDAVGDVLEKSLLVTRIRTIKNVEIIVPNSSILGSQIINYSLEAEDRGLILHTTITIGYDTPWPRVHECLVEAALATPGVLSDPRPFVLQTALNDFHISYEINAYTREPNRMAEILSALHTNIQDSFRRGGLEIMSPTYLSLRDGNRSTIPPA